MQVCTLLQTDNHASNPPLSFFTGRMPFLPPNQQCESTEGFDAVGWSTAMRQLALQLITALHTHTRLTALFPGLPR